VDKNELKAGTRVALDMTTLTIMRYLPREVDPLVYNMSHEDPGNISYSEIGGLSDQVRELREVIELPLNNPELFQRVGISPPKGLIAHSLNSKLSRTISRLSSIWSSWNRKNTASSSGGKSA